MGWIRDILCDFVITSGDFADYKEVEDFFNTVMACTCVLCAGLAAGLTMGLLSLDITKLEIKCRVGTEEEKRDALAVLPIVKRHHLLLVTLLLFNSIANETLPIFLGELVPNYLAILLAVFLILIFGEILPSAFFTGQHQLRTSARLVPVVYCLFGILYPVAFPISKLLDRWFGEDEESPSMTRTELEALVLMQQAHRLNVDKQAKKPKAMVPSGSNGDLNRAISYGSSDVVSEMEEGGADFGYGSANETAVDKLLITNEASTSNNDDGLSSSEVNLMLGVLNLSKLTVGCAMIPLPKVYMISGSNRLDDLDCLHDILHSGFSRIPVHSGRNKHHLIGYLLVKELIVSEKNVKIEDIKLREPLFVRPDVGLLEMLGIFQEGQCHLAVVTSDPTCAAQHLRSGQSPPGHACIQGIVTLEDVLEKVIQGDITDETDTFNMEVVGGSRRGVTTTTLVRKINRAHTVGDLLSGDDTVSDRRRSRSRTNLNNLSSINVVAGDVRHKERSGRESYSPVQRSPRYASSNPNSNPNSPCSPPKGLECLDDVVDTIIVDCELDLGGEGDDSHHGHQHPHYDDYSHDRESVGLRMSTLGAEDFVQVDATETTHLLAPNVTAKLATAGAKKAVR